MIWNTPNEEINDVYNKVDEIFKIKLKAQLKGTGLIFSKIQLVKDLLDGSECYNLTINNKVFGFNNTKEFYYGLSKVVKATIRENQSEIDYYEQHKINDLRPDIIFIDETLETLFHKESKYNQLETQLQKLLEVQDK